MDKNLFPAESNCLAKQFLSPQIYQRLKGKLTESGFSIDMAIGSGIENPDSAIGLYAGDAQAYTLFSDLFKKVIQSYHKSQNTHVSDLGPIELEDLDPGKEYILSTRIRTARNIKGIPFPPHMDDQERTLVEKRVTGACRHLPPGLAGEYISLENLDTETQNRLRAQKLIFPKGDRFMEAAGVNRGFPKGRGTFISRPGDPKSPGNPIFMIWVNEEDHLRIISMETSSNIARVFNQLARGIQSLSTSLEFALDPLYGNLTSCPTNIGTGLRAGVHIRLEKLDKKRQTLERIVRAHHLQIRGTGGEKTRVRKAVFDISNKHRLGKTERQIILDLHQGLKAVIEAEQTL